jgi:transposase-like protein
MKKTVKDGFEKGNGVERVEDCADLFRASRLAMIQMLIPVGLKAVEAELQAEVQSLVGPRYSRGGELKRWGSNRGSVYLGDQKVSLRVPRVRDVEAKKEVDLKSYQGLQDCQIVDDVVLSRVIHGLSQGHYEKAALGVAETFGIGKSSVSKKFIRSSGKKLQEFLERDLSHYDFVAVFLDGKAFADNEMVIALGVTLEGEKILLGFIETSTENHRVCRDFLNSLLDRGLKVTDELLFIIDGAKGLYKGIKEVFGESAVIQRCQWHKRENVVSYLDKKIQSEFRRRLQAAYEEPTYEKAKKRLLGIKRELQLINRSAVVSLEEGLEETLTLHRLGLFKELGTSFKTTNCIENTMRQLGDYTDRVCYWKNSDQRRRWVATGLLDMESRLRLVKGHKHLKDLRAAMKKKTEFLKKAA